MGSRPGIGLALPTRDRPLSVVNLLRSLEKSTIKLDEIAIVSYGADLTDYLKKFRSTLNIIYLRSAVPGQVIQKREAIRLLSDKLKWCIFSDDDLLFDPWAVEEALRSLETCNSLDIKGIGFALPSTSRVKNQRPSVQSLARFFFLNGREPGSVLKGGQTIDYLNLGQDQFTSWLNGVSMWKMEEARNYGKNMVASRYAACEDLIFSYPISKRGKLIFAHKATVRFQKKELTDFDSVNIFKTTAYFRLFFVQTNSDLSSLNYLWSQFARTTFTSLRYLVRNPRNLHKYWITFFKVMVQCGFRRRPFRLVSTLEEGHSLENRLN